MECVVIGLSQTPGGDVLVYDLAQQRFQCLPDQEGLELDRVYRWDQERYEPLFDKPWDSDKTWDLLGNQSPSHLAPDFRLVTATLKDIFLEPDGNVVLNNKSVGLLKNPENSDIPLAKGRYGGPGRGSRRSRDVMVRALVDRHLVVWRLLTRPVAAPRPQQSKLDLDLKAKNEEVSPPPKGNVDLAAAYKHLFTASLREILPDLLNAAPSPGHARPELLEHLRRIEESLRYIQTFLEHQLESLRRELDEEKQRSLILERDNHALKIELDWAAKTAEADLRRRLRGDLLHIFDDYKDDKERLNWREKLKGALRESLAPLALPEPDRDALIADVSQRLESVFDEAEGTLRDLLRVKQALDPILHY